MKICIKICIHINLFSQILGMPRHTGAYPWRRHCSRSLLPRSRAATMADLGLSSPISLHPPPPASISPPTASHRHHEPSPLLLVANPHQQHLPPVLAGSHRLRATLAANTTKKVYAEEGSAKSKQFNVLSASMHCLQ